MEVPLEILLHKRIASVEALKKLLNKIAEKDGDALVCFDYGKLWDLDTRGGHVSVFDRIDGEDVWLVDPERNVPKHRKTTLAKLFNAIDFHGPENTCGVWEIKA